MRIVFNYPYHVHYLLVGGKRPVVRSFTGTADIDIAVVTDAEAPVASSWTAGREANGDIIRRHVRAHEGRTYQPFASARSGYRDEIDLQDAVRATLGSCKNDKRPAPATVSRLLGTNHDEALDRAMDDLGDLLVVDGTVYARCDVPRLRLCADFVEQRSHLSVVTDFRYQGTGDDWGVDRTTIHPLAEYDALVGTLRAEGRQFFRSVTDVTVLIPEPLEIDTRAEGFGRTVGQAIADNDSQPMNYWPRPVLEEFLDIRERYDRWLRDPACEDAVALLDRTYRLFTTHNLYSQALVGNFLANYDTVQAWLPEMPIDIRIDLGRKP